MHTASSTRGVGSVVNRGNIDFYMMAKESRTSPHQEWRVFIGFDDDRFSLRVPKIEFLIHRFPSHPLPLWLFQFKMSDGDQVDVMVTFCPEYCALCFVGKSVRSQRLTMPFRLIIVQMEQIGGGCASSRETRDERERVE